MRFRQVIRTVLSAITASVESLRSEINAFVVAPTMTTYSLGIPKRLPKDIYLKSYIGN